MADSRKVLKISNLDPRVTEETLHEIFNLISPIHSVKITKDNQSDFNCGFVEFYEHQAAEQVLHTMDKRILYSQEISVNWIDHVQESLNGEPTEIFVSGLDPNADDNILADAFEQLNIIEARVISNGEGVVTFKNKADAEKGINTMNGSIILSSPIRCHWGLVENNDDNSASRRSSADSENSVIISNMSYEDIFTQTPLYNTSIKISNLPKKIIKQDIASHLQQYGFVSDVYINQEKQTAVVKLDTHANAATAIFALQGFDMNGQSVRMNWAKDRPTRSDSQECISNRSYNVFSSGCATPNTLVNQITNRFDNNHTTMRPPAPTSDTTGSGGEPGGGLHGWNQYYQQYYSAGHLTI